MSYGILLQRQRFGEFDHLTGSEIEIVRPGAGVGTFRLKAEATRQSLAIRGFRLQPEDEGRDTDSVVTRHQGRPTGTLTETVCSVVLPAASLPSTWIV